MNFRVRPNGAQPAVYPPDRTPQDYDRPEFLSLTVPANHSYLILLLTDFQRVKTLGMDTRLECHVIVFWRSLDLI